MKKEKTPNIRFKKFEHNWFKECLNKVSNSIEYGLNASAKDFDGIHKYLRITDIDESSRLFLTDKLSSPDVNFTIEDYENYKLQKNDLLFARTGASVGKTYLYRESDGEVYYAGFLIRARLRNSYDGNFIFQQTLTEKYKQFIEIISQRSGQPGVNGKEYGEWNVGMTTYHEQSAISSLFRTLDDLLTSYKYNLANYQSLKTTMLSKMFPKAGQTVPEIRLDGFEGEWDLIKLGDFCDLITKGTTGKSQSEQGQVNFVKVENLKDNEIYPIVKISEDEHFGSLKRSILYEGDVLFSIAGTLGRTAIVKNSILPANTNQALAIIRGYKLDAYFLLVVLSGEVVKDYIRKNPTVGAQPNLSLEQVSSLKIKIPSLEEQQAIGSYFSNLDNLISAHQEKISQLETLKKKLLQDMFI